jgi:hypothetical protein
MQDRQPAMKTLGVYRVPRIDNELREQLGQYYFFGNAMRDRGAGVQRFLGSCIPLVLFELLLTDLDERFSIGDFTQEIPGTPPEAWQAAYDEAVLSADGSQVFTRNPLCTRGLRAGRIGFYFHFYDPLKPMRWTYGEFLNPPVEMIPERLWKLMPYSPVD